MARRRTVADQERTAKEIRAPVGDGIQVQKTMRCGHTDWVFNPLIRHSDLGGRRVLRLYCPEVPRQ